MFLIARIAYRSRTIEKDGTIMTDEAFPQQVVGLRPTEEVMTRQRLPYFVGVSARTAGAKGLSMHIVVIPPGAVAEPHMHDRYETAIYVLEGRVETRYGEGLSSSVISQAGDFLFIPPNVPHEAINLSNTEPAERSLPATTRASRNVSFLREGRPVAQHSTLAAVVASPRAIALIPPYDAHQFGMNRLFIPEHLAESDTPFDPDACSRAGSFAPKVAHSFKKAQSHTSLN
jgi:uncharacterized RmlC-like cupin family protein